ncbi:MAG: hypothetical protein J6Y91_05880 [Alphaproteobacteria bacterium]|nr:hypothetical protein [Alphaproteobacteria bacterium]
MTKYTPEEQQTISPRDIEELKPIYEDYFYMARQHELLFRHETVDMLSFRQIQRMYPDYGDPRWFVIPWSVEKLNVDERKEFADYVQNNAKGDGHKTYISIQHIKPEENTFRGPAFSEPPYTNLCRTMQFPSMIEEYTISYPEGVTLGETEFYVDGRYKAVYSGDKSKDKLIADCLNDLDMVDEISVMLNLGECFRQNDYKDDEKFGRMTVNVYAAETVKLNENNLLEILGSFAEKVKNICNARYHNQESAVKKAREEGFLNLPDSFQDYLNIRNLMRHQWDTLDDLGGFTSRQAQLNKRRRTERVNSYLKLCDKTLYQRMISYVETLQQMQQVIGAVDPTRLVREAGESNSKFSERVKMACRQNPDKQIEVEMNYPLESEKYKALDKLLHKKKIFPNIKIIDDVTKDENKLKLMLDYNRRSLILRDFHDLACYAMGCCQRCGEDKDIRSAWNYLEKIGVITPEECQRWQGYTTLRNTMAHDYFDENIRKQLHETCEQYTQDFADMAKKLYEASPDVKKIRDDVYEYKHSNGEVVRLDFNNHTITRDNDTSHSQPEVKNMTDNTKQPQPNDEMQKETYPNGVEYELQNGKITKVKLPLGMSINLEKQRIKWDVCTHWYMNAEYFNVLKTDKSKIVTDKDMIVTEFYEKNRKRPFRDGDCMMIDNHHNVALDNVGRLREFRFRKADGKSISATFRHAKNGRNSVAFADGTTVYQTGKEITVMHGDVVLNYDNRQEFAKTYEGTPMTPQQMAKTGIIR